MKGIFSLLVFTSIFGYTITDQEFFDILRAQRQIEAHTEKSTVAEFDGKKEVPPQHTNRDEELFVDLRGNFSKSLKHQSNGFVDNEAYESLRKALRSKRQEDFLNILIGQGIFKLANPQGSFACSLSGNDGWINAIDAAPSFSSAEAAGEMVELYWTTLVRDVPFNAFDTDATALAAIDNLNSLSDFRGPKVDGIVTPGTFLRGNTPGDLIGPYISQFLYQTIPFGTATIPNEFTVPMSGTINDFMTDFTDWYTVETGGTTGKSTSYAVATSVLRTPRDLAEYVHLDSPGQSAFGALLLLMSYGNEALDRNNPYLNNPTQDGFVTFNIGQVQQLLRNAVQEGLKAAWYHKWQVNRRLRPEEYGFYVQEQVENGMNLGINSDLTDSPALTDIFATYGSYFLPQAYPEGSPTHPSYPAGHATLMGAAVTILKAFFNENFVIPDPLQLDPMGIMLVPYTDGPLLVGNELNKLAANISLGRDHAGVHYRSDGIDGMLLGEKVAIDILNNESFLFNEDFKGFTLTKFDGSTIIVGGKRTRS